MSDLPLTERNQRPAMARKKVYLETMGCQMNVLDSELVMGQLRRIGYELESDMTRADLVLLNTCSVRDHAEQKVLSRLGSLTKPKLMNPDMIIGVMGCMAERDPESLIEKMPHVELICGPNELNKIPAMIGEIEETRSRAVALSQDFKRKTTPLERALDYDSVEALDLSREPDPGQNSLQAYIRVQRGCDKFCTYCIVPFTRGLERSRPASIIVEEAKMLADRGTKEITLVGQTVNSYIHQESGLPIKFAELLSRIDEIPGIERLRFVTSFPGDFDIEIFEAMRDLPTVCEYLHIPVQSGSDRILKLMNRQYTVGEYEELIGKAREIVPGITLASDFIVGFCGETEDDHEATKELIERCQFKNIFVFKYSPRPGTASFKGKDNDVPDKVKRRRNVELLDLQERISLANNQSFVSEVFEVLVEGPSKAAAKAREAEESPRVQVGWRNESQLVGRTRHDRIVVFEGREELVGQLVSVKITSATALTFHGDVIEPVSLGR